MYVIESKEGYISKFTLIFDKTSIYMKEAFVFKNEKDIRRFFIFRERENYKVVEIWKDI